MTGTTKVLKTLCGLSLLLLGLVALVGNVVAQTNRASISGTVKDAQGAVVAEAEITVTNANTGISRQVKTNNDGVYSVPLLEVGTYTIVVSKSGFQTAKRENVALQTATESGIDFELTIGNVSAEVTITSEAPLVQTQNGERGTVITGREITELPLSGRNFTQLATLTPGVVRSSNVGVGGSPDGRSFNNGDPRAGNGGPGGGNPTGGSETSRFARSGGANISANGQRPTNNNFSLDGVDNNEPQYGTIGAFTNPDSIAEFKVSTSVPSADIGRAAGAVVTVTTKSGGNKFSGSMYYYGQNSGINAYHPSLKTRLAEAVASNASAATINSLKKATQQIHEFGGTFGGPIVKERAFFFFDYLGQRNNFPTDASTGVPAIGAKNGDFSQYPIGSFVNPYTGQPFAGNQIPANLINPTGQNFIRSFPNPTISVNNPNTGNQNFFIQRRVKEVINNYRIKIDTSIGSNNSLTGSYSYQKLFTLRDSFFGQNGPSAGFGAGEELGNTRTFTLNDVHTFSPNVLNEARFGINAIEVGINNCGVGGACGNSPTFAADLGIPNVNLGNFETSGTPGIFVENWGGGNGNMEWVGDGGPFRTRSVNPYFADTVTVVKGNSTIKFGGELRLRQVNTIDGGRLGATKGVFIYGANGPAYAPNAACPVASRRPNFGVGGNTDCYVNAQGVPFGGSGNGLADILLGLPAAKLQKSGVTNSFNLRSEEIGLFISNDWKVSDRLNVTMGLRYDLYTPQRENGGRYSLYDPARRTIVVAQNSKDSIVQADKNNFGPRVSFAYSLNQEKTLVVRGGYGISYTLDGTDIAPGISNVPFSPRVNYEQVCWGCGSDGTNIYNGSFGLRNGPPPVPADVVPAVLPTNITVYAADLQQKNGYVHQYNLSMQYQFAKDYSIDIGYVGNKSRDLLYTKNIGTAGTAEARNSAGGFISGGLLYTNGAKSQYDAMQAQLRKRLSNGFEGQISYTWSHTLDNSPGVFGTIGDARVSRNGQIDPRNLNADWGNSGLDTRHLLSASGVFDLPFGQGRKFLNQGKAVNAVLGGWQMNVLVSGRSGYPFSVVTGAGALQRPSLIGNPFANLQSGRLLNAAAFSNTAGLTTFTNASGTTISYGNLGRNTFNGPSIWNTDVSLFKNFTVMEKYRFQLGIEFYNAFNNAKFTVPNNNISDGNFGEIKYNLMPGRVIQYRMKFNF